MAPQTLIQGIPANHGFSAGFRHSEVLTDSDSHSIAAESAVELRIFCAPSPRAGVSATRQGKASRTIFIIFSIFQRIKPKRHPYLRDTVLSLIVNFVI